mmetsp:Transcript_28714/g.84668  ORF Transcript_28714/g.84668 Transcript_28714/m.84668 type:complete len:192 (+) Transcript_28714:2780-3355(+)
MFASYLGLPIPACHHFVRQYVGSYNRVYPVDAYRNVVAAHAWIPGGGHGVLHSSIQTTMCNMTAAAGAGPAREYHGMFHGKVGEPQILAYCEDFRDEEEFGGDRNDGRWVIPDIFFRDFPLTSEDQEHTNGAGGMSAEAIVEVKGIRMGVEEAQRHRYPADHRRGVDKRAEEVRKEYVTKCRKLDRRFAPE